MLRIGIVEDDIDALINVIRNLLALDSSRYEFEMVPVLLSDPQIDTAQAISARVNEYGIKRLGAETASKWPQIMQKGLLCPVDEEQRAEILEWLAQERVDAIICDSWLGKGTKLESTFDDKALKLAGLMLLDDAEKDWAGKCWIMTMYQGDVFEQLKNLLEDDGWRPARFNVMARFLQKDKINNTAPGECYLQLERLVDECLAHVSLAEPGTISEKISEGTGFGSLVGRSQTMLKLYDRISKIAPRDVPVVIQGDSGVGKELVAREIHLHSARKHGPFVAVDCGAIPAELMESELFGRSKGGFTGASTDKAGLLEIAKGGTIFFDELGNLPPLMQMKLLRALQEGEARRVGSNKLISFDARVLAATHKDLSHEVDEGRFRGDLLQRIAVINMKVPPLRERQEDIKLLCEHFIIKHAHAMSSNVKRISDDAIQILAQFSWPWNVRELENCLKRAIVEAGDEEIIDTKNEAIEEIAHKIVAEDSSHTRPESGPLDSTRKNPAPENMSAAEIWVAIKARKEDNEECQRRQAPAEQIVQKTLPEWAEQIGVPKTLEIVKLVVAEYHGYPPDAETRLLFNSSYNACWKGWMHRNKHKNATGGG